MADGLRIWRGEGRIKEEFMTLLFQFTPLGIWGIQNDTAIWFWQQAGNEVRLIDYHEHNRRGLSITRSSLLATDHHRFIRR